MSQRSPHGHGRTQFYIEGEGFTPEAMPSPRVASLVPAAAAAAAATAAVGDESRAFRFGRMFPQLQRLQADDAGLIALGMALTDPFTPGAGDADIPAGFTYLGQFVDHDITFDQTEGIPSGSLSPEDILSGRTPALELDSVYGRGPVESAELYAADGVHLAIGVTSGRPDFGVVASFPNDLPRRPTNHPGPEKTSSAIIGDPRNDENLIVAQTHLAFLKLHNVVVDRDGAGGSAAERFDRARKVVVQHYQSIVLHDFVPRLVEASVLQDVLANGRRVFLPGGLPADGRVPMPVEFSVAAYRLGHSMIRNAYQWNRVFSSNGTAGFVPRLNLFFKFSRVSGDLGPAPSVPSDWIVDWRRMYDFSERPGGVRHPQLNRARQIDSRLADGLQNLPEFAEAEQEHLRFLAARNLLRGRLVGLPSGQAVSAAVDVEPLAPTEVASGPHAALIQAQGFDRQTPLWFYLLKEAEVRHGGMRLGPVGSRLMVETFHALVESSEHSILREAGGWKPTLPSQLVDRFTMLDLLHLVDDVNPLGD